MAGMQPLGTLGLEKRVEELLDEQGFEDADDWGPDQKGYKKWADEVQKDEYRRALSTLVGFLEELLSAGLRLEPARRIIGPGHRSVKMMRGMLDVRNNLVAMGVADEQIDSIVTSDASLSTAQKQMQAVLNPPSALEKDQRPAKRERKQSPATGNPTAAERGQVETPTNIDLHMTANPGSPCRPVPTQVWGQRSGVGRIVAIVCVDGQRLHTVRLYRHWELFTFPYNMEAQHWLVSADRRESISLSALMMSYHLIGRCEVFSTGGGDARRVPVCDSYVYHGRFPVSFRSRPVTNDVLGLPDGQLCVCCDSCESLRSMQTQRNDSGAQLVTIGDHLREYQGHSSSDDEESVVHSQSSVWGSDEEDDDVDDEATEATADDDEDEDEDEGALSGDIDLDLRTPLSGGAHKRIQAIELYAGCGGLAHLAGCSHGATLEVAWAVECMPEAAATYRANHPTTKVLEITTSMLLEHICYWMDARQAWLDSQRTDEPAVTKPVVTVKNCQIMQERTLIARDGDTNDSSCDEDDFADSRPWIVSKILDFQAVTRPHKPDPLARGASKQNWIEYRCVLQRGSEHRDGWVEFETSASIASAAKLLIGQFVDEMARSRCIPLPECVDVVCGGPPCQGVSGKCFTGKSVKRFSFPHSVN